MKASIALPLILSLSPLNCASALTIMQIASDSGSQTSFTSGVNFDPAGAPSADHDYVNAEFSLRAAPGATFGGNSLTLGDGTNTGTFLMAAGGTVTYTIGNLFANNGRIFNGLTNNGIANVNGVITVQSGGLSIHANGQGRTRITYINSSIGGNGHITISNPIEAAPSINNIPEVRFTGTNSYSGGTTIGHLTANASAYRVELTVTSASSLGSGGVIDVLANGRLILESATNLAANQGLWLNSNLSSAMGIELNYVGTSSVAALSFDGGSTFTAPGTYGATGSGAAFESDFFAGTGLISVVPEPGAPVLLLGGLGGILMLRRRSLVPR